MLKPNPYVMVLGGGTLGGDEVMNIETLRTWLVPLEKKPQKTLLPLLLWEDIATR